MGTRHGLHAVEGESFVGILGKAKKKDILVVFNPRTPDRTLAIKGEVDSPIPFLEGSAKMLKKLGADYFGVPCNTAHYFLPEVTKGLDLPLVGMIEKTAERVRKEGVKVAGLLATTGTVRTGLYQKALEKEGIRVLIPPEDEQEKSVMEAIYGKGGIKAGVTKGQPSDLLHGSAYALMKRGAECIIAGCTEIPIVLTESKLRKGGREAIVIDPSRILAEELAKKKGVAGVAGGLGPAATVDLLKKINDVLKDPAFGNTIRLLEQIVLKTPAKKDQEHLTMLATALREGGAEKLELAGVDLIAASRDWKGAKSAVRMLDVGPVNDNFEERLAKEVVAQARRA